MTKILSFVQNLSLDIAVGAVISCWFIGDFLGVPVPVEMAIGLGIAIWLIYTADHLLDARKTKGLAINPRHAFHQKHQKLILAFAILAFGFGIYNSFRLPLVTVYYGLILTGLSGAYFAYLKLSKTHAFKELFAAIVYTAGIFTGPLSVCVEVGWLELSLLAHFFLSAYANLLVLPLFELEMDARQGVSSIATRNSPARVKLQAQVILIANILLMIGLMLLTSEYDHVAPVLLLMPLSLVMLLLKPGWFRHYQLYRVVGDGIFFIPALALL